MKTDSTHCPSVELNLIWNEKIFMLQKAYKLNIYNSDYFMWIDVGILHKNIIDKFVKICLKITRLYFMN